MKFARRKISRLCVRRKQRKSAAGSEPAEDAALKLLQFNRGHAFWDESAQKINSSSAWQSSSGAVGSISPRNCNKATTNGWHSTPKLPAFEDFLNFPIVERGVSFFEANLKRNNQAKRLANEDWKIVPWLSIIVVDAFRGDREFRR